MKFLESIDAYVKVLPGFQVAFIGHNDNAILELLSNKVGEENGHIKAFIYDRKPVDLYRVDVKMMEDYSKNFRTVAREYELLILNDILQSPLDQDKLMKNAFKALENSGDLLVVAPSVEGIAARLETFGFVAINEIETDDETKVLISAKKMHGWGHGL